jgi:hypothetical protein
MTRTMPAGITELDYTCWELRYDDDHEVHDGDGVPHFKTEDEAQNAVHHYERDRVGRPNPRRRDQPCFIITAACGHLLDEDGGTPMHHDTAEEAAAVAKSYGWRPRGDGRLRCSADCDQGCNEPVED